MYTVGIDLGTSSVKLLMMEEGGRLVRSAVRDYPLSFPKPGWSEQDPDDWWRAVKDALRELTDGIAPEEIAGVSFGGQMHGLVILDEDDMVIRPAILWNDGRTVDEVEYLNGDVGKGKLTELTGNIAFAGFTAPKILWIEKNEPENFARIRKIMLPKDFIAYRLSGVHSTDYSDASGMLLLDVEHKCWSEEMLSICHVKKEQMPALYESYDVTGTVLPDVAKECGLSPSCKVIAGAGDNAAAAVGTGTVGNGKCNISLGTSGTIFICRDTFGVDSRNALHSFAHADGAYHLMGCILSAASCNSWWMEKVLVSWDYAAEQEKIGALGENHVYFLPYLMGERSPHNDPLARGTFTGLTMDTTESDMLQAVMEGVCFAIRDCFEAARSIGTVIPSSRICGGGAKSRIWCEMMADVLGIPIETLEVEEGPGLGAAILAAVGCGLYGSVAEAAEAIVKKKDTILPDPALVEKYEERYAKWRKLYPALKEFFAEGL